MRLKGFFINLRAAIIVLVIAHLFVDGSNCQQQLRMQIEFWPPSSGHGEVLR